MFTVVVFTKKSGLVLCILTRKMSLHPPRRRQPYQTLLCFVVVIHWLIFPYPSGLLHWHVPAKQPWWIWINTSCEFIMNDCITTTKQSTAKPCAYFLGYTVSSLDQHICYMEPSYYQPRESWFQPRKRAIMKFTGINIDIVILSCISFYDQFPNCAHMNILQTRKFRLFFSVLSPDPI